MLQKGALPNYYSAYLLSGVSNIKHIQIYKGSPEIFMKENTNCDHCLLLLIQLADSGFAETQSDMYMSRCLNFDNFSLSIYLPVSCMAIYFIVLLQYFKTRKIYNYMLRQHNSNHIKKTKKIFKILYFLTHLQLHIIKVNYIIECLRYKFRSYAVSSRQCLSCSVT